MSAKPSMNTNEITHSCGCSEEMPCPKAERLLEEMMDTRALAILSPDPKGYRNRAEEKLERHIEATMLVNGVPIYVFMKRRRLAVQSEPQVIASRGRYEKQG